MSCFVFYICQNCKNVESTPRKTSHRRAKDKAEAALQSSLAEGNNPFTTRSDGETQEDGKPEEVLDQSAKADQSGNSPGSSSGPSQDHCDAAELPQEPQEETQTPTRESVVPFNTPDYRFECICGELGIVDYKARVQCMNCQLWQHANCVNYKEESLETTPFYCPHCLVAMKPVSTGATLIISPSSICHQWVEEINRHIRSSSLRVLVRGVLLLHQQEEVYRREF